MTRSRARTASGALRVAAIAAVIALAPALAACAAGANTQTQLIFPTTAGASVVFHDIAIRDAFVLGPPIDGPLLPGESASMFLALVNDGPADRLTAISAPGTAAAVTIRGGGVSLRAGQAVLLTGPEPQVVLKGLQRSLTGGAHISLTFNFQNAGSVSILAPVMPRAGFYATYFPPPPSPAASATSPRPPRPRPGGTSSPSPTATP